MGMGQVSQAWALKASYGKTSRFRYHEPICVQQDCSGCCMENAREQDCRLGGLRRGHCRTLKAAGVPGARTEKPILIFMIFFSLSSHGNLCRYIIPRCLPCPQESSIP